jgi:hypothetical protein
LAALLVPATASATRLPDGTRIRVRLLHPITSETSKDGQPLEFVVVSDVVVDGEVVIAKGTRVAGTIVKAKRARWGFLDDDRAKLVFVFSHTTASNGRVIRLRASPVKHEEDSVAVDRLRRHHELQWAGEADTFVAYVDGHYLW